MVNLLSDFEFTKLRTPIFQSQIIMVSDKTFLGREKLHACYVEVDNRTKSVEIDLIVN